MRVVELGAWKKHEIHPPSLFALGRGDVDFTGSPSLMSIQRLEYGQLMISYWTYRSCFLFLEKSDDKIRVDEVISPFSLDSWYVTIFSVVVCSISLSLLFRLQSDDAREDSGLSVILIIGAICQQGYEYFPHRVSVRIAMVVIGFYGMLLYNYYTAFLVSARLNDQPSSINDSLNELAKTNLVFASEPVPYFDYLLRVSLLIQF